MQAWKAMALIALLSGPVLADNVAPFLPPHTTNGRLLLENCSYNQQIQDLVAKNQGDFLTGIQAGVCGGQVLGALETLELFNAKLPRQNQICVPPSLTTGAAIKVVYNFLMLNPLLLNEDGTVLILLSLKRAYPCG